MPVPFKALPPSEFPEARIERRGFQSIWLIPLVVALIVGFLAIRSYVSHGPTITIRFSSAKGLSVGQTSLRYKFVVIGTVEGISLSRDGKTVDVRVQMAADTKKLLSKHARFWIENPHLGTTDIASIVSGTYIALDPGSPGGGYQTHFTGLDNSPGLPVGEMGTSYMLVADHLGAIAVASPLYYRDINVGEVIATDVGDDAGSIRVKVFVRAPYDKLVKPESYFWNASAVSAKFGPGGLHVELQSLQSVLNGGIAFATPGVGLAHAQAAKDRAFTLYVDEKQAKQANASLRIPCVTYVQTSIKDLAIGSPVQIFGIHVGEVTDIKLSFNQSAPPMKARIGFEFDPELAFGAAVPARKTEATQALQKLVQSGMRAVIKSTDLIAGQEVVALEFTGGHGDGALLAEGNAIALPADTERADLAGALGMMAAKLNQIPFEQLGEHLNHLIASADNAFDSADMRRAVHSLAVTLDNARALSIKANTNLTPALQRLPAISTQLQDALTQANEFMTSANADYGQNSEFQRNAAHTLDEVNDAARSIRLLADYLEHHPEALIEGKPQEKQDP